MMKHLSLVILKVIINKIVSNSWIKKNKNNKIRFNNFLMKKKNKMIKILNKIKIKII